MAFLLVFFCNGIAFTNKIDNEPAYISSSLWIFFQLWDVKHITSMDIV